MIVTGTNLYMTRGDSEGIMVFCPDKPFADGDKVEMTIRPTAGRGNVLLHKEVTDFIDGQATISIEPDDTSGLKFGTFSYDIQVTYADGSVKTIIRPSAFEIGKENTYAG